MAQNAQAGQVIYPANVPGLKPAIANGFVYVGSNDHNLYAFNQVHTST